MFSPIANFCFRGGRGQRLLHLQRQSIHAFAHVGPAHCSFARRFICASFPVREVSNPQRTAASDPNAGVLSIDV